ncbi:MAG TPA: HAMP domain-containing sensor histidine kinase [Acidimicrobiia bacterium]
MAQRSTRRRTLAVVASIGVVLTIVVSAATAMSARDAVELVAIATGTAAAAGVAGALGLGTLRSRSVGVQVVAVALTTVMAVALGAWVAVRGMFISDHDLSVLLVVLVPAGTMAVVASIVLGGRVVDASAGLADVARRIGDGSAPDRSDRGNAPSELARLAQELETMSGRLEDARVRERAIDGSRRELVAWVSHDLRTPLAGIRAMVEALEDGVVDDPETVARYHRSLREEADRLAALVDDLFELSRSQAGVLRLELERVSLADVVCEALAGAAPVADAKGVRLHGVMRDDAPTLRASAPELLRALRNILENAIRHTPSDGTVVVEAGVDGGRAFIAVVDHGGGIPEPALERVFDVAFRVDPARQGPGAGLGLAIARGLVEAHDGDVSVRNENGGCRFTVRLPVDPVG